MRAIRSCGLALLASMAVAWAAPASGSAQETTEYRVREGDTCGSIARRVYGNSQRYDLIHRANPALGPMPHNLEPGTVLTLPRVEGTGGADATVTAVRRQVASQAPRAPRWDRARVGQELGQGWRVNTEERSTAELTFRSSSVVSIRERTLVIVYGASVREAREESARAVVREGSMLSRLSALSGGESLEVETSSSRATLRTGEASVDVDEDGTTRVAVHAGEAATVRRSNGRNAVAVPAGMGTKVRRNRAPSRPRPLPRAPSWLDGAPRRFVAIGAHGGTLRAAWEPVPDAARYRVEVARRADGRDLVFATEVDAEVHEVEMRRVPPGTYHLRVATIDGDRFEGRPGSAVELTMLEAAVIAPGASASNASRAPDALTASLEDLDSGLADLDFENLPDRPAEVLQHSRLAFSGDVRCTVSEQPPEPSLVLGTLGAQILRCGDDGEPIADATLRVTSASLQLYADATDAAPSIERGDEEHVRVVLEGADPGGLTLAGGPGVAVAEVTPHPRGGLRALLRLTADAPEVALVRVVTPDDRELASATVHTIAPPQALEVEPEAPYRPHALSEALGLAAFASWVGLRDERRRGSGMHLAVTGQSAADGDPDALLRLSAGLRASMLDERLRLDVTVPLDIVGSQTRSAQRGSRDVYAAASSLLVDDRELGLGLAAEAGVWIPTAGAQGLDRARLTLAVDASLRFMDERLAVRTRQAGLFDLEDDGSLLWASAYGFDVWIAGPLSAGVELSLVMGREDARDWIAAGVGGGVALEFHPIVISLSGRYGFGDDAILGRGLISAAVRGTYDL